MHWCAWAFVTSTPARLAEVIGFSPLGLLHNHLYRMAVTKNQEVSLKKRLVHHIETPDSPQITTHFQCSS